MSRPTVGFIGLGIMGKPMALNVLKAGFPLVAHNRSRGKVEELLAAGAQDGGSPRGVAERAEVILLCLPDAPDVEQVVAGPGGVFEGLSPGKVIVDMSTSSPALARRLAAEAEALGAAMLDAPVSGGETGAREGTLSIMVGGDAAALERVMPVLQAMGKTITHIGPAGAGQVAKACNQLVAALMVEAVAEAMVLAMKAGVDPLRVRQALLGGAVYSRILENQGLRMLERRFAPGFRAHLHHKDLRIALSTAREYGAPLPGTALVHELYGSLVAAGKGEIDNSALITVLEALAGLNRDASRQEE